MFVSKIFAAACALCLLVSCTSQPATTHLSQKSTEIYDGMRVEFDVTAGDLKSTRELMFEFGVAFASRDRKAFEAVVTDDFVWRLRTTGKQPEGTELVGIDAVVEYLNARELRWRNVSYTDHRVYGTSSHIFQPYKVTGVDVVTGAFNVNGLDMYTLRDGKIAIKDSYWKMSVPVK